MHNNNSSCATYHAPGFKCNAGNALVRDVLDVSCTASGVSRADGGGGNLVRPGVCPRLDSLRSTLAELPELLTQAGVCQDLNLQSIKSNFY
jgi:hypothetical protein